MIAVGTILFVFLLALLILFFLRQLWTRRHLPPGPLALPLIGTLWASGIWFHEDYFREPAKRYGNIYSTWLGSQCFVVLSGFKTVKEVMTSFPGEFSNRSEDAFLTALGKKRGIIFSNGQIWKQHRHIAITSLRKLGLGKKSIEHQIEDAAQTLVESFRQTKVFGYQFAPEDENFQKLIQALEIIAKFTGTFFHMLFIVFPQLMKYVPGPHKDALASIEVINSFAKQEVEKHKESSSLHEPQDFIDHYFLQMEKSRNDPNSTFNEENLAQCIIDFFGAGTETVFTTLMWALLFLTNHPDIQGQSQLVVIGSERSSRKLLICGMVKNSVLSLFLFKIFMKLLGEIIQHHGRKVQKEIEDAFNSSASISYQDRRKLPYTNAVIHEMQRFKSVFIVVAPRQSTKDVKINSYHVPKGTMIFPNLRSVLLDPEQWETPEEFNPNHFLDKDGKFIEREEFLPFGIGQRACLGEQLARIEIFIFLTNLLRAFSFQLPEGVKELSETPIVKLTVHPHPYKLCAISRKP